MSEPHDASNAAHQPDSGPPESAMTPDEARRLIAWWVEEGELKDAERQLLLMHLRAHPESRAELEALRHLDARLRDALRQADTSPDFTRQVLSRLPPAQERDDPEWMKDTRSNEVDLLAKQLAEVKAGRARAGRRGRKWLLPAGLALLIFAAVSFNWVRGRYADDPAESSPIIARYQGEGAVLRDGTEQPLEHAKPRWLKHGDIVEARMGALTLELENNHRALATVHLGSGAQLKAFNRHQYKLLKGEAYFSVRTDRPRGTHEVFDVDTPLGHVQVLGTVFGIVVPSENPARVAVVVDHGRVKLQPLSGASVELTPGEEASLLAGGGVSNPAAIPPGRLAWVRPSTETVATLETKTQAPAIAASTHATDKGHADTGDVPARPVKPVDALAPFDWQTPVRHVDFRGLRLPQALERLSERMNRAAELQVLAKQAAMMPELPGVSRLVVLREMPAAAVLRWLAREQNLRFENGMLRPARPGEVWGAPASGLPTGELATLLAAPLPPAVQHADGGASWAAYIDRIADRIGLTVMLHPSARSKLEGTTPDPQTAFVDMRQVLKHAAEDTALQWFVYDEAVVWADAPTRQTLTRVMRRVSVAEFTGVPLQPTWAHTLQAWVEERARDPHMQIDQIALHPDGPALSFRGGLDARARIEAGLAMLRTGSPACLDPLHGLDEHAFRGSADDLAKLIEQARAHHVMVQSQVKRDALPAGTLDNKTLPLGRVIAWAARLQHLGVRADGATLIFDEHRVSYGTPQWQVLRLESLVARSPEHAAVWPVLFAEKLREVYPVRFAKTKIEVRPFKDGVLFYADREVLAAAQKLRDTWIGEAQADTDKQKDPRTWQPAARRAILENLQQPYRGMGEAETLPAGALLARLRGSGRFFQLRATLIIDPATLDAQKAKVLPALPVKDKTLGDVLVATAAAAGLKMYVEDDAVWLRPTP